MSKEFWIDALQDLTVVAFSSKAVVFIFLGIVSALLLMVLILGIIGYNEVLIRWVPKDLKIIYHFLLFVFLPTLLSLRLVWVPELNREIPAVVFYVAGWIGLGIIYIPITVGSLVVDTWKQEHKVARELWLFLSLAGFGYGIGYFTMWLFF